MKNLLVRHRWILLLFLFLVLQSGDSPDGCGSGSSNPPPLDTCSVGRTTLKANPETKILRSLGDDMEIRSFPANKNCHADMIFSYRWADPVRAHYDTMQPPLDFLWGVVGVWGTLGPPKITTFMAEGGARIWQAEVSQGARNVAFDSVTYIMIASALSVLPEDSIWIKGEITATPYKKY